MTLTKARNNHPAAFLAAKGYIEEGLEEKARNIYLRSRLKEGQSARDHAGWAGVAEELGLLPQAREDWERAVNAAPDKPDYLIGLAGILMQLDQRPDRAVRLLRRVLALEPDRSDARELLGCAYRVLGWEESARTVSSEPSKLKEPDGPRRFPREPGRECLDLFLRLFSGREVGFAEEIMDPETGEVTLIHREGPLGRNEIRAHILGERTLAWYPMRSDLTVTTLALSYSLRNSTGCLSPGQGTNSDLLWNSAWEGLRFLRAGELPAYMEQGPGPSARIWLFLERPIHFLMARRLTKGLFKALPIPRAKISLQPFLITEPSGMEWKEQAVPLPLGVDKRTGIRRWFMDHEKSWPAEDQIGFLHRVITIKSKRIRQALNRTERGESFAEDSYIRNRLLKDLIIACPVIRCIAETANSGRILSEAEKRILFYTVGFLDSDHRLLHKVLGACPDYRFRSIERQAGNLFPRPISCRKIRALAPWLTASVDCACLFGEKRLSGGRYPSPVLHIDPRLVPSEDERLTRRKASPAELARHYLNLCQEIAALEEKRDLLAEEIKDEIASRKRPWIKINGKRFEVAADGRLEVST